MIDKVKISQAFLRNCEGFMFEKTILDKIDTYLKPDNELGMTLKGLSQVSPRDLTMNLGEEGPIFTRGEVNKIIDLLGKFDLTLKNMVRHDYNSRGEKCSGYNNVDYEDGHIASPEIEAAAEKVWEDVKDFGPETPVN